MTLLGWDASHFDGPLSRAILARAYAEGIRFFTHKVAESLADTEGTLDDTALAAARDAGVPFVGGYLIPRTNATPAAQVQRWVQLADAGEPWWRTCPGWFWQIDLERWSYDNVPASVGIDCARRLRDATGRQAVLYASRGQYGDSLTAWDGPLWNADYRAGPGYPGDNWVAADKGARAGWAPYSGQVPAILQYTSSATIAGLTTCDANAFRGTVADFATLIGVPRAAAKSIEVMTTMPFLAKGPDGTIYLCTDDYRSHPFSDPKVVSDIVALHQTGARPLGTKTPASLASDWGSWGGVEGIVRNGWYPEAYGPVAGPLQTVLSDADRQAIIGGFLAGLPADLAAQVATAVTAKEASAAQAAADALRA